MMYYIDVGGQARVLARIVQVGRERDLRSSLRWKSEINSYLCLPDLLAQYYGTNNEARCCLLDSDDIVVTLVLVAGWRFCFYRRWLMMADTVDEGWTSWRPSTPSAACPLWEHHSGL